MDSEYMFGWEVTFNSEVVTKEYDPNVVREYSCIATKDDIEIEIKIEGKNEYVAMGKMIDILEKLSE